MRARGGSAERARGGGRGEEALWVGGPRAGGEAGLVSRARRAPPVTAGAVRASAGALLHLPRAEVTNLSRAVELLKDRGVTVVGVDEDSPRTIYDDPCPAGPVALVVGSEGAGI